MEHEITFEALDRLLGDHAPFLMSLSDGMQEELHIIVAAAEVGEIGSSIPDFEGVDETTQQALHEVLADTRPIEINEHCLFEICFHDYIIYQIRNESFWSGDPHEVHHGKYLITFEKSKFHIQNQITSFMVKGGQHPAFRGSCPPFHQTSWSIWPQNTNNCIRYCQSRYFLLY